MNGAFQVFFEGWIFIVLALCAVGVIALLVGALWMYQDAQRRRMDATLWLIFLIIATLLGTVVGFVIVVVLYLIIRESHPIGGWNDPGVRRLHARVRPRASAAAPGRLSGLRPPYDVVPPVPAVVLSHVRTVPVTRPDEPPERQGSSRSERSELTSSFREDRRTESEHVLQSGQANVTYRMIPERTMQRATTASGGTLRAFSSS